MSLNAEQNRAVAHRGGGLLVLAGAGTGKTRVITHRIDALVGEGVDPRAILAVTFTNKAAKEMRERLSQMGISDNVWIGTFHATGARVLRMYPELVGYTKNFTIYDGDDQKALVRAFLADVDTKGKKVADGLVLHLLQQLKGRGLGPKDVGRDDSGVPGNLQAIVREVYSRYEEALLRSNAMDFADLLLNTAKLLRNAKGTRAEHMLTKFKHVLVDEFQDTNSVQMEIADLFATKGELCVVGDDDQCQPAGTMVRTPDGEKPIEEIQAGDLVVSWDRRSQELNSQGRPVLRTSSCESEGYLHRISTSEGKTVTTRNHKFLVRWAPREALDVYVTYLMYREDLGYRVGWCQLHGSEGCFHFGQDMELEKADLGWILQVTRSRSAASTYESIVASRYRIPTVTFETPKGLRGAPSHTEEEVRRLFKVAKEASSLTGGGRKCLTDYGRRAEYPFWPPPGDTPEDPQAVFECYAANLLPELMLLPSAKTVCPWVPLRDQERIDSEHGLVFSLEVEEDGTYVADGVVTHNSIYGWRGANPDGMMDFADRPGVVLVKLEENYRCTTPILECANAVIRHNSKRLGKTLRPNKDGELVRVSLLANDRAEALQVAATISEPWGDHAVLYRTHAQSRPIEEALRAKAIPYTIVGGLRFYDRSEVKDVLAFFKLAVNPKGDVDLLRVANKPARGMGPKKMGSLKTFAAKRKLCTFDALKESGDEKAGELRELLLQLSRAKDDAMSLLDFFDSVMRLTGYREALKKTAEASKSIVQREKALQKIENVNELANDLSTYQQGHVGATVGSYLEHVALVSSFDKESGPAVCLMTIHAAKGLEFPHVHLVGFEENLLPHANSVRAAERYGKMSEIEEERRLTYVAITRAKDKLDITFTRIRSKQGRPERAEPSRFLAELPDGRFKKIGFA